MGNCKKPFPQNIFHCSIEQRLANFAAVWMRVLRMNPRYSLFGNPSEASAIAATTTSYSYTSSHTLIQLTGNFPAIVCKVYIPDSRNYA